MLCLTKHIVGLLPGNAQNAFRNLCHPGKSSDMTLCIGFFYVKCILALSHVTHGVLEKHAMQHSLCSIIAPGATDVVKLLLKHGADPQATCNEGKTPFDQARTSPEIRLLLHKANRDADSSAAKRAASCANCGMSCSDYCIFFMKLPLLGCRGPVVSTPYSRLSASGLSPGLLGQDT